MPPPALPRFGQAAGNEATPLLSAPTRPAKLVKQDPLQRLGETRLGQEARKGGGKWKEDNISPADMAVRVALLGGVPTVLYVIMLLATVIFYDEWPFWVLVTYLLTVLKSFLVARFFRQKRWRCWLGIFMAVATTMGFLSGLLGYYHHLVYYEHYRAVAAHTNVAASESVLRFEDSGLLSFTADAHVDASRSVGYQSALKDARLCVAPVMDGNMAPTDPVSLFAIGVDCCEWRAAFHCGDANDAGAHGGALRLSLSSLVSEASAWIFEDGDLASGYGDALHLQQAAYGTVLANHTRFIYWAKSPETVMNSYRNTAVLRLTLWSVFFVLALCGMATLLAAGRRNVRMVFLQGRDALDLDLPEDAVIRTHARPGRSTRTTDWLFRWL
mmetsp:Transcript_88947/g.276487  ORF Transcript_88947/g.276487 Transcript_88947/m.276487 type:complete len:385 (-) Transcript_88947:92-1246(-)